METIFAKVPEVAGALGLSETRVWQLIAQGEIESVLVSGRCRRVPVAAVYRYARRQADASGVELPLESDSDGGGGRNANSFLCPTEGSGDGK